MSKKYSVLILTDKQMYAPGDNVKFRVVVFDKNSFPYHPKTLSVKVFDEAGKVVFKQNAVKASEYIGIYEEDFKVSETPVMGNWRMTVLNDDVIIGEKIFKVAEELSPRFAISMSAKPATRLSQNVLKLNVFAKSFSGLLVKGKAKIKSSISADRNKWQGTTKTVDVESKETVEFDFHDDLKLSDELKTKAFVTFELEFEEALTGEKGTQRYETTVCNKACHEIVIAGSIFKPGFSYTFRVNVFKMETLKLETDKLQKLKVKVLHKFHTTKCSKSVKNDFEITRKSSLKQGSAEFTIEIPLNVSEITITASYENSQKSLKVSNKNREQEFLKLSMPFERCELC